jgi:hypothetical protein
MAIAPPTVPLSPQSSWGGASLASLREILEKEIFKTFCKGISIPLAYFYVSLIPFFIKT